VKVECPETDLEASVDALAVERVVSNLLSNGMKFTPRGGSVTVTARSSLGGVHLSVCDTGAGMEPAEAQALFQRYSRLEKHAHVAGTGLGLFIVKSVVSAHGGSVEVTSAIGAGTTFDLYFPDDPPVNARGEVLCLNF
jgi:signal transduction histidine kinase